MENYANSPVEKYYEALTPRDRVSSVKLGLQPLVQITRVSRRQTKELALGQRRISSPSIVVGKPASEPSHHSDGT
jgi:hypothetical protein